MKSVQLAALICTLTFFLASFGNCQDKPCVDTSLSSSTNDVSDACLGCICESSTHCNLTTGCIQGGNLCGPFLLTRPFWIDAGKCLIDGVSPTDPLAFEKCATDLSCASRTLRSYLHYLAKDCDGDQLVTCADYAMIHKNGGYICNTPVQGEYWQVFNQCREMILKQGINI